MRLECSAKPYKCISVAESHLNMWMSESQNAEQAVSKEEGETAEAELPLGAVHLMQGPTGASAQRDMNESGGVVGLGVSLRRLLVVVGRLHVSDATALAARCGRRAKLLVTGSSGSRCGGLLKLLNIESEVEQRTVRSGPPSSAAAMNLLILND